MTNAVLWLLTVEALGLLAFPAAYALFPALRDRGFGFAKPLGMLMLALPVWWLGSAHVPLGPRATAALVFVALAVAAALLARRMWPELSAFVRREWRLLLATEAVFLAVFVVWALLRAGMPGIQHTEQPMDFAFLNASMIAATFPPGDPWLSAHGISYYYFGYLTMGLPGVLADIPSGYVYNLALVLLPAMAAMGVVSLVTSVAVRLGATLLTGFGVGLLGALMLGFLGNLEGVFELLRAWGIGAQGFWDVVGIKGLDAPAAGASLFPSDHWWWWRSSRVIDTVVEGVSLDPTIHEYPFFSWFLGDLHPHVMSIPFVLLFMAFTYVLLTDKTPLNGDWWRRRWPFVLAMGLSLGALGFINAWDLPVFLAIGASAAMLRAYRAARDGEGRPVAWAAGIAGSLLFLGIVPYLPYYAGSLAGQVKGIALVTTPGTSLLHFLIVWGMFALAVAAVALSLRSRARDKPFALSLSKSNRPVVVAAALGLAPFALWLGPVLVTGETGELVDRLWVALPLSLALPWLLASTVRAGDAALAFVLGAAAMGVALVLGPELYYVVDFFGNRMNTVFKLYYQAWTVLAVVAPLTLYFGLRSALQGGLWLRRAGVAAALGFAALAVGAFYLPAGMALTVNATSGSQYTLDATAFLREQAPGEHAAIEWLRDNAEADDVIVEAVGDDYSTFGRVASFTGLPSPLNWPGHELQWRGSSEPQTGRAEDVAALYGAPDAPTAEAVIERYGVRYVVLGPRERGRYGVDSLDHLAPALSLAFVEGDVQVYEVTGDA
ncbi:MAG: DUF2298 domain-containing protein [Chloroflexota bacterium]|nr:DUF2298 domain-containing protein [Chloroflexota bacterium]